MRKVWEDFLACKTGHSSVSSGSAVLLWEDLSIIALVIFEPIGSEWGFAQLRLLLRLGRDFAMRTSNWFCLAEAAPCYSLSTTLRYPITRLQDMQI